MNKLKYVIYISSINILFAGGGGGSWINDWLMPSTGLLLWSITTFMIVLIILRWKAWGPLMDALDARAKQIEESLSKAKQVSAEAEQQAEKNEEVLNQARQEAQDIVSQARDAGDKLKQKLEADGQNKYETMLQKAQDDINSAKEQAMNEIKSMVVDVAINASEKVIKRNLNDDDNKRLIEETVDQFKQTN